MRHILWRFKTFKLGIALPQAGAGLLTSSVTLASALWVTVTLPNMPLLHAFDSQGRTSVSISLQSALLGIDDGNGREARALARSLGLTDMDTLPTPGELRAFATSPTPVGPVVTQLNALALNASVPPNTPETVSQQRDVTPTPTPTPMPTPTPTPPTPPAAAGEPAPVPTHASTPTVTPEPKSSPPVVTHPASPQQPAVPAAPTPPIPAPPPVPPGNNEPPAIPANPDVPDTTPPALHAHANVVAEATGPAGAAVSYSLPTAQDSVDGAVPVVCAPASGVTFALGHTTVTCSAQDAAHNTSSSSFDVDVRDSTGPTIQAHADIVVEAAGPAGTVVVYTAPTATDLVDSSVSVACAPASGATFSLGHTTVTCSAHDSAGNQAATRSFDVNVRDTTGPVIQAHADIVVEATGANGATLTYTPPTALDAVSGAVTVTCLPASGGTFALGHTTVACSAQDAAHNASSSSFDVDVRDTTAPTITVPTSFTVSTSSPTGTAVAFAATATDAVDGTDTVACTPSSGTNFPVGHATVTCTAIDNAGNTATSRSFDVVVTTPQSLSDATQSGLDLVTALGNLGLPQSVYDSLTNQLYAAGNSLIQNGDAVAAWQEFNAFDVSAQTQLTAAQYLQVSPYILDTRAILGW